MEPDLVTAFVPVSESFVVAGDSESRLSVLQVDWQSTLSVSPTKPHWKRTGLKPVASLGKCSHSAISSVVSLDKHILAASGLSASIWDAVSRARLRYYTTSDSVNCAEYITSSLVAIAGDACTLSIFDTRNHNLAPSMAHKIARDNLYGMAVDGASIFCGGADGNVYKMDLRNQLLETWELPHRDAIIDLKVASSDHVLALTESGTIHGVGSTGPDYEFSLQIEHSFAHRVKCDVMSLRTGINVACGGEAGLAHTFHYDGKQASSKQDVPIGNDVVAAVRWSENGLFVAHASQIVLIEGPER